MAAANSAEKKAYRATVLADQRHGKKRIFPNASQREKAAVVEKVVLLEQIYMVDRLIYD